MDVVEKLRAFAKPGSVIAMSEIQEAADEIERLRGALKHYADEKNWTQNYSEYSGLYYIPAMDRGDIARSALHQKETE